MHENYGVQDKSIGKRQVKSCGLAHSGVHLAKH